MPKYHKLVRDRIPEIIEESGKTCLTEILSDEDYLKRLMPNWMKNFLNIIRTKISKNWQISLK